MTFTYSGTDLSTDLAKVRLSIGDTIERSDISLTDEEIAVYTTRFSGDWQRAAIAAMAEARLPRLANKINTSAGSIRDEAQQLFDHAKDLLKILKQSMKSNSAINAYAGGTSQARKDTTEADTDFPHKLLPKLNQFNNYGDSPTGDPDDDP